MRAGPSWDPEQYERFRDDRARPFHDLLARVPEAGDVRTVADLGCGAGGRTLALAARWPGAEVWGVDSSPAMLSRARAILAEGRAARAHFVEADLRSWDPPRPLDRLISNAALHWVPDHRTLLARLRDHLTPGGWIAVQMPNNREEPAYRILFELLAEPPWKDRIPAGVPSPPIESAAWYAGVLEGLGLEPDLWETTYFHRLASPGDVVEWMKGSILRPVLNALGDAPPAGSRVAGASAFLAEFGSRVESAYVPGPSGILFPFKRLFFVARKP